MSTAGASTGMHGVAMPGHVSLRYRTFGLGPSSASDERDKPLASLRADARVAQQARLERFGEHSPWR